LSYRRESVLHTLLRWYGAMCAICTALIMSHTGCCHNPVQPDYGIPEYGVIYPEPDSTQQISIEPIQKNE